MDEDVVVDDGKEPMVHQVGKLLVGTIVGFVAQHLACKGYDAVVAAVRAKNAVG